MSTAKIDFSGMLIELGRLLLHFPQCQRTPEQLQMLAEDYLDALGDYDADVVTEARKKAQRSERFFPTIAVLRDYCGLVLAEREEKAQSAYWREEEPEASEEQRAYAAHMAHLLRLRLGGDADAAAEMDAILEARMKK